MLMPTLTVGQALCAGSPCEGCLWMFGGRCEGSRCPNGGCADARELIGSTGMATIRNTYTTIGEGAFHGNSDISYLSISPGVHTIDEREAFAGCRNLAKVELRAVTTIKVGAFRNKVALRTLEVPNTVTIIESDAFASCTGLETVTLGDSFLDAEEHQCNPGNSDCRIQSRAFPLGVNVRIKTGGINLGIMNVIYIGFGLLACLLAGMTFASKKKKEKKTKGNKKEKTKGNKDKDVEADDV
jgi:hypothetical protein